MDRFWHGHCNKCNAPLRLLDAHEVEYASNAFALGFEDVSPTFTLFFCVYCVEEALQVRAKNENEHLGRAEHFYAII